MHFRKSARFYLGLIIIIRKRGGPTDTYKISQAQMDLNRQA